MSIETNIFNCLLESNVIYDIYSKIGTVLKTSGDIANEGLQGKALSNTIELLLETQMIEREEGQFRKTEKYIDYSIFSKEMMRKIHSFYRDAVSEIVNCSKHYDEVKNLFFINENDIPLKLKGLAMLMGQLGEFYQTGCKVYFLDIDKYMNQFVEKKTQVNIDKCLDLFTNDHRTISLEELQNRLKRNAELGEEAERFALEYEKEKLKSLGIKKEPHQISLIDVSAGYDIASYFNETEKPDKYIEVKSCNEAFQFYISRNEIEKAKEKRDSYFLYLYERKKKTIIEVQNPYESIFQNQTSWRYESESFVVTKID